MGRTRFVEENETESASTRRNDTATSRYNRLFDVDHIGAGTSLLL